MYAGNECGEMISFCFLQSSAGLLRKKHNNKITLFYWQVMVPIGRSMYQVSLSYHYIANS